MQSGRERRTGEGGEGGRGAWEEARVHLFSHRVKGRGIREKEEKEGEVHGRREDGRRLGHMDFHQRRAHVHGRREHGFASEEGTWIFMGGGHTVLHQRRHTVFHQRRAHNRRKWFEFFLLSLECAC
jgi:hypothetical protein